MLDTMGAGVGDVASIVMLASPTMGASTKIPGIDIMIFLTL